MSRTWSELLGDTEDGEREESERTGFLGRLRDSLGKSRRALQAELSGSFDASREDAWEQLEIALIRADVGVPATAELVRRLEARGELADLGEALAEEVEQLFGEPPTLARSAEPPMVVLVVGVNGTGKTTTIGKLARKDVPSSSAPPTPFERQRTSSSRSGRIAPARSSSAAPGAPTPRPSPSTRSRPGEPAVGTSSSSIRPGGCTRRGT